MNRFHFFSLWYNSCLLISAKSCFAESVSDLEFELIWYFLVGVTSNNVKQNIEKKLDKTYTA